MLSIEQAITVAQEYVAGMSSKDVEVVLNHDKLIEKEYGWVFFYNSAKFYETKEFTYSLVGNGPFIVRKDTGEIVQLGSYTSVAELLSDYESRQ
jgi:hypothetical protein